MAVAEDHLPPVGVDGHHLHRDIGQVFAAHHRGVLVARLIVAEDADVLQTRQLQVIIDSGGRARLFVLPDSLRYVCTHIPRGVVVTPVDTIVQASVHVEMDGESHVAIQELGHLKRELTHVELTERQAVVRQVVIEVVGIAHDGWLLPVDGTAAAAMAPDIDVGQLMDIVLHRQFRQRVLNDGDFPLRGVVLVVVILMGEYRVGHVALHEVVRIGVLTIDGGILARGHGLLQRVFFLIGLDVQVGGSVVRRNLEDEVPVLGFLNATHDFIAKVNLGLYQHFVLDGGVIDAYLVVGIFYTAILYR